MSRINDPEYNETDNRFVKDINNIEDSIGDQRVAGGKRVDEYVREKGGIQYRDRTIDSIAEHPDIQVCAETLRRWWAYFRLHGQMGEEIKAVYPKARARDYYELSRLLDAPILTRDGESQEDARRRVILETVEFIAHKRKNGRMPCSEVGAIVTRVADAGTADSATKSKGQARTPARCSKAAKAFSFQDIGSAVDFLVNFSDPAHLESGSIPTAALGKQFTLLSDSFMRLADHLAREVDKEELLENIRSVRRKLDELETILGTDSFTWAEDSDTGVKIQSSHAS